MILGPPVTELDTRIVWPIQITAKQDILIPRSRLNRSPLMPAFGARFLGHALSPVGVVGAQSAQPMPTSPGAPKADWQSANWLQLAQVKYGAGSHLARVRSDAGVSDMGLQPFDFCENVGVRIEPFAANAMGGELLVVMRFNLAATHYNCEE